MMANRQQGMTLLEVLIGVFILMLITATLAQASWLMTKGKRRIEEREVLYHQARMAMQRIVTDVQMALLVEPKLNTLGRDVSPFKTGFLGQEDSINLTTTSGRRYVAGIPAADQREVGYSLEPLEDEARFTKLNYPEGAKQLVRREDTTLDQDLTEGGSKVVIAEGILKAKFEYWEPKEGEWISEWDAAGRARQNMLPRAVRITLTFPHPTIDGGNPIDFQSIALVGLGPEAIKL